MMIIDTGRLPVPGDSPAGVSVREDQRFSDIQHEMDLLTSLSAENRAPDWPRVVSLGSALLSELGKDIMVAAWMGVALLHTEGPKGILTGATVLADMCSLYWEGLFPPPKRLRARMGAIDWWQEHVEGYLSKNTPESLAADLAEAAAQQINRLQSAVDEAVADNDLRLFALAAQVRRLASAAPSPATAPAPQPTPAPAQESPESPAAPAASTQNQAPASPEPAQAARPQNTEALAPPVVAELSPAVSPAVSPVPVSPASPAAPPAPALPSPESARLADLDPTSARFASVASGFCLDAAEALFAKDRAAPGSYILRRTALWGFDRSAPPSQEGVTALPAPEEHILPSLKLLLENGEYEKALASAESYCNAHVYWLDLSAVSAAALAAMGPEYAPAALAVKAQLQQLILRLPELPELSFEDGAPFASADTRALLAALGGGAQPDPFERELADATDKDPTEALKSLGALLTRGLPAAQRLTVYTAIFTVCAKGELWQPLPPVCAEMLRLLQKHDAPNYAPAASAHCLEAAHKALSRLLWSEPDNQNARDQFEAVSAQLAPLRPHALLA